MCLWLGLKSHSVLSHWSSYRSSSCVQVFHVLSWLPCVPVSPARGSRVVLLIWVTFGLVTSFQRVTVEQSMTLTEGRPGLVPKSSPVNGNVCLPRALMLGLVSPMSLCARSLREHSLKPSSILTWKNKKSKHFLMG